MTILFDGISIENLDELIPAVPTTGATAHYYHHGCQCAECVLVRAKAKTYDAVMTALNDIAATDESKLKREVAMLVISILSQSLEACIADVP